MKTIEFKIESRPELEFRTARISPVELLAITSQMDPDKFVQTKALFEFGLEHIEVKVGEKWFPVKIPGQEVYMPTDIEEDLFALNEILGWFTNEVVARTFTKSSE